MRKNLAPTAGLAALALTVLSAGCAGGRRAEPVSGGGSGGDVAATAGGGLEATVSGGPPANPLLREWTGPYGGVPAFDRLDLADLEPALDAAIAENLREIEAIAASPEPPGFDNTIAALERTGRTFERVETYYGIWRSNLSTPELRQIQARVSPKLAERESKILQNAALFRRVAAVHAEVEGGTGGAAAAGLRPDQRRLVELVYDRFARNGATLEGAARERYAAIQRELAELHTRFANNVLADEETYVLFLDRGQLGGLPESFVAAAAAAAAERGQPGR
jgi:peptidyl-dipeptidase Dcp